MTTDRAYPADWDVPHSPQWIAYRDAQATVMRHRIEHPANLADRIGLLTAAHDASLTLSETDAEDAYHSAQLDPWRDQR